MKAASEKAAWRQGVNLAVDMLEACSWLKLDDVLLDAKYRDGAPQTNFVHAYLQRLREADDVRVEAAFAAVLTEYVGAWMTAGTESSTDNLRRFAGRPVANVAATETEVQK